MKDRKLEIGPQVVSLLRILAFLAWGCGLLFTILSGVGLEYMSTTYRVGNIFYGLMMTALAGGVLYGLACVISLIMGIRQGQTSPDKSEQPE